MKPIKNTALIGLLIPLLATSMALLNLESSFFPIIAVVMWILWAMLAFRKPSHSPNDDENLKQSPVYSKRRVWGMVLLVVGAAMFLGGFLIAYVQSITPGAQEPVWLPTALIFGAVAMLAGLLVVLIK